MPHALLIDGIRTPFANFGGSLGGAHPTDMGIHVTKALLERTGAHPADVEELIFGNVLLVDSRSPYLARHVALGAGLAVSTSALVVNRLCGSGLEAVVQAAVNIQLGRTNLAVAGGSENMSMAPYLATQARWGSKLGDVPLEDLLQGGLTDRRVNMVMGQTAERLASKHSISREEQDAWALTSQTRAEAAIQSGKFAEEIAPVELPGRKGPTLFSTDEFVRGAAAGEKLASLRPVFEKEGTVTAGNASGINDGASAMLVASEDYARDRQLKPLARIVAWASQGCEPAEMGIGPAVAIPAALKFAGLKLDQMDLVEVNEAFAAQYLAVQKTLSLDPQRTNVNGGAIAIGHPLGASGNRVLLTLCRELARRGGKYGVASLCIGGGQGIAMVVENLA